MIDGSFAMPQTIFALSTIFGASGIAVIRISGPDALAALPHLRVYRNIRLQEATLCKIYDQNQLIDSCIIITFRAPHSFTGEDIVEIHCHGSRAVIKKLLAKLSQIFQPALAGEFTKRAFLNGKMDLTQVEGLADLLNATTEKQAHRAFAQLSGRTAALYEKWRHDILHNLAFIEAYIDFPDETQDESTHLLQNKIANLIHEIQLYIEESKKGEIIKNGFSIAIIGEPNAGKSTLFNYLAASEMAIVSEVPGTTRDTIEVNLDFGGYPINLIDTAGIRNSNDLIEKEGIKRAKAKALNSDLNLLLVPYNNIDTINSFQEFLANAIIVATKAPTDWVPPKDCNFPIIPIAVLERVGLEKLYQIITARIADILGNSEDIPITNERHRHYLELAILYLKASLEEQELVLATESLRLAAREIGKITGKTIVSDDILGVIFKNFCIGK